MYKNILLTILLNYGINYVTAQSITPLLPGEKIPPNISLQCSIYPYDGIVKMNDLKGKFVLFYFWSTGCGSCIGHLPILSQLQTLKKDSLQIVMISYEPKTKTEPFIKKWETIHNKSLKDVYFVNGDTLLKQYFPYKFLSTTVWISPNGCFVEKAVDYFPIAEKLRLHLSSYKKFIGW